MKIYDQKINKEMVELLDSYEFVEKPTFSNYDTCSISEYEDYIELCREEKYERDDNGGYKKVADCIYRRFKKNTVSGVFVEC